jgi:hypothetical protein
MTEYELADLVSSYSVQGVTCFSIWLSVVSAYAISAYAVGSKLTPFQISWLNTLYLTTSFLSIWGFRGSWRTQVYYIEVLKASYPGAPQTMNIEAALALTVIAGAGTLATLVFMWQVRHRENQ